eukprot:CAMPEP_0116143188 /NCGR_PEP_ID=MMETSP0329-20121206/15315_1 /TAXON_ID=697910 /ORGANISM="Pseudo-nitzschia arenysensis, Strain B593" /LENGTH=358 /DNA_ID=CAMNT_0003638487 /DNA_START=12 /DNA_END=1088 /DNA_ORIENTATION=+
MKLSIAFATAVALLAASDYSDAYSNPKVTPVSPGNAVETDNAMSQYEAALKAAFEQASATAVPSALNQEQQMKEAPVAPAWGVPQQEVETPPVWGVTKSVDQMEGQEEAIDQYGAALKAALESSSMVEETSAPPTIVFGEAEQVEQPDWANISKDISSRIEEAEFKIGKPLDASAKGEIVGTVLAGSAVLGTAAINSPLLLGAALGYAGTHVLGGKRGEELKEASMEALTNAIDFTQTQLDNERGDISKAGARIVEHLQNEAIRKSREVQKAAEVQAHQVAREISDVPSHLVEESKKLVQSEEFQEMPKRTFKAVSAFLGSDEVKRAKQRVLQSIQDGLESEEMQAMKDKASNSLKNM